MFSNDVEVVKYCTYSQNGDKTNQANYRPIFSLPILSKPLERHIVNLLLQHLVETQPISDSQ